MTIEIKVDETLDPEKSVITINGILYKDVESLQLRLAKNAKGELTIQHGSGYLETYKAEVKNDI